MPGGDGTGPMGLGPMSGRGMGFCVGNFGRGRGFFGRGGARGWRQSAAPDQEINMLKREADILRQRLSDIQNGIDTLGKGQAEKTV